MTEEIFKPGFDGIRGSATLTGPERALFRQKKADLIRRLHDAMLTLSAVGGKASLGIGVGATPAYIVEFGDRVGEEKTDPRPAKFRPTAAQVSDMDSALDLLQGLRTAYFKVVLFRALHEFSRQNGEVGDWPWSKIGGYFGLSDRWAENAYDAAIIQAARRGGLIPAAPQDFAIVVVAAWVDRAWLTNIGTGADPRQAVSNLRVKSPVRIEQAFAIWTAGQPMAKRIMNEVKVSIQNLNSHGSWYKSHPDVVSELLIGKAQGIGAAWMVEDILLSGAIAA